MVKVENLVKRYGPTHALDGISFEIEKGDVVGFLGPNGAGKTTTLRILTGFLGATAGTVRVAGHDVSRDSLAVRRRIGYMPEGVPLYGDMRVTEYLNFRARLKEVPRGRRNLRVNYVMDQCGIQDARGRLIRDLSKGYRQRVGLAECLIHDPPLLIMDEPTLGLDPNQVRQVRQLIRGLGGDHTVLLSTHILSEVETVCKRVLILHHGRLVFQDALESIAGHGPRGAMVIVEVAAPANAAAEALRRINGVTALECEDRGRFNRFELQTDPTTDVREEVFALAARNGWTLRELQRVQPSLEEVFVRLTGQE